MGERLLWITVLVNKLLGKPAAMLLAAIHVHPSNPEYPIPGYVAMQVLVFLAAIVFFLWLRGRISVENPGMAQQCMEGLLTNPMGIGARDLLQESVGHDGDRYLPMIGSIGIYILLSNLISVIPTLESPTATVSVPLGCAIVVFLYYNFHGIRHHGPVTYGKHFMGPILAMSPLMVVVETVSHFARLLSLTVRLWVNMMVSDLLYVIFLGLSISLFSSWARKGPWATWGRSPRCLRWFSYCSTYLSRSCRRSCLRSCR